MSRSPRSSANSRNNPGPWRAQCEIEKASSNPGKEVAGSVSEKDIEEVAKRKMPDLNANDLEAAKQQVRGTARSMGLTVTP